MNTKIQIGKKYLITTSNYFMAPNGLQYSAVHGTVYSVSDPEETLGIKTNRATANWYIQIGNAIIAGCQINYAICTDVVNFEKVEDQVWGENGATEYIRRSLVYNADV